MDRLQRGRSSVYGATYRRIIWDKTEKRLIYDSNKQGSDGSQKLAVRIVTLSPSTYSWHLDYFAEEDLEQREYKLKKLGKEKTRLDMIFKNKWEKRNWAFQRRIRLFN